MKPNINISLEEKNIIESIVCGAYQVIAFGSRVSGKNKPFSDLDLCLKSNKRITIGELAEIKDNFENSALPFTVDVIDYNTLSPGFKKIIDSTGYELKKLQVAIKN